METGLLWRYGLCEEKSYIVRSRSRVGFGSLSTNVLEPFGMVWTDASDQEMLVRESEAV